MTDNQCAHRRFADISLPYFKQGDDLAFHIEKTDRLEEALERHAQVLDAASKQLRGIAAVVAGREARIYADTHRIEIQAEQDVIDRLIHEELASLPHAIDDEEEAEDEEEDESAV